MEFIGAERCHRVHRLAKLRLSRLSDILGDLLSLSNEGCKRNSENLKQQHIEDASNAAKVRHRYFALELPDIPERRGQPGSHF